MPVFDVKIEFTESGQARVLSSTQRLAQEAAHVRRAMADAGRSGADAMERIGSSAEDAAEKLASLGKTVLGLVGAYQALDKARSFMERGIKVGSEMESYKIGMATLITSMVKLEDGQGHLLEGAQKYQEAMGMAAKMMQRIQKLGLETTATTQSLVQGTQSIMASALAAGIQLEKVPDFAVAGAQAMQTIGIPLNQMRTELDALLTGVVNGAQDILAPKLFADKGSLENIRAYIKELKASGKLVDEVMRRLEPFKIAGQDIAQTYTGLMSNLEEAIDIVAMNATDKLLGKMKEIAQAAQDLFVDTKGGATGISKDFEHIAALLSEIEAGIGDRLLSAVTSLINGVKSLNSWLGKVGGNDNFMDLKASAVAAASGIAILTVARKTHLASAVAERGGIVAVTQALAQNVATVASGTTALLARKQASVVDAQAELARARALATSNAEQISMASLTNNATAAIARKSMLLVRQPALIAAVTAAETRLAVAQKALAAANFWGTFAAGARAALTAFSNMLGGPVGIALTAATAGIVFLTTRTSEQEKAIKAGEAAWNDYQQILAKVGTEADGTAKKLDNLSRKQLENDVEEKQREVTAKKNILAKDISSIVSNSYEPVDQYSDAISTLVVGGKDYGAVLTDLSQKLKENKISAKDAYEQLLDMKAEMRAAGQEGEAAAFAIQTLIDANGGAAASAKNAESELNAMAGALDNVKSSAQQAAAAVQQFAIQKALAGSFTDATPMDPNKPESIVKVIKPLIANTNQGREFALEQKLNTAKSALVLLDRQIGEMEGAGRALTDAEQGILTNLKKTRAGVQRVIDTKGEGDPLPKKGGGGRKKKGGGGRGGKSDAEKIAQNADRYSIALEKMRNEVEALENASNGSMTTYDRMVAKINAEKEAAIKNADVKARETVSRKQATQAQAEEMASLEKRKAELDANQKLDELELKTLRDKSNFYKEFAELTGRTGESIQYQNELIDKQAKEWVALGIPMNDVQERIRLMKLEISDNPIDGLVLGLHKYASDVGSLAKTMSDGVTQAFSSMEDAFVQFALTGKMQFKDMANSIIADLMRIAMRSLVLGPIANALGSALGGLFGSAGSALSSGNLATMSANGMVSSGGWGLNGVHGHALGSVFTGIGNWRNAIVSSPTFFTYGSQLTRYAKGGVMGEAGPEAIMPLTRMSNGSLGVASAGGGVMELSLTIVDKTQGGVGVEDAQGSQNGLKLDVIVQQIDGKLAGLAASGKSKLVGAMEKTHRMPSKRGWN